MKRILFSLLFLLALSLPLSAATPTASELLERGIYLEQTKGDLTGAIETYEEIIEQARANRSFVARAQYRLGLCQLGLGHKSKAASAFKVVIDEYPEETSLVEKARQQMPMALEETFEQIEENYFEPIDRDELMQAAIRAMVEKLDRSSDYLDAAGLKQVNQSIESEMIGIGAQLRLENEQVVITRALFGSPAAEAGLVSEDRIVAINGNSVADFPTGRVLPSAVDRIRGPAGQAVTLDILRGEKKQQVRIVRRPIRLESVRGDLRHSDGSWNFWIDPTGKIGYVRVLQFTRGTAEQLRKALEQLEEMRGLILDLRFNPGGLLSEAVDVADLFLEEGTILTSKGRHGEQEWTAHGPGTFSDFKIAILVNSTTASSAEIVCAALQDHERAIVVGERTFGQGLIKSLIPLQGGETALKLPTATYFRPNGKNIHRRAAATEEEDWGVRPDPGYEVRAAEEDRKSYLEYRAARDEDSPDEAGERRPDSAIDLAIQYFRHGGEGKAK